MKKNRSLQHNQSGDTIVEVLLSIVIVSAILGAAFITMNKGLNSTRASQERSEALKYAESQLEYLRVLRVSNPTAFSAIDNSGVCLEQAAGAVSVVAAPCAYGVIPGGYRLTVSEDAAIPDLYNVRAEWDGVGGTGQQQLDLKYRLQL